MQAAQKLAHKMGNDEKKDSNESKSPDSLKTRKPNCPGKHGLEAFKTPQEGYGCDFCSKRMNASSKMYGCRKCDYDVCDDCYNQIEVFMKQVDTTKGVEFKIKKNGSVVFFPTPFIKRCKTKLSTAPLVGSPYCPKYRLESVFDWKKKVANSGRSSTMCSFIDCVELAYMNHYPLVLKPEHIFILILQGIGTHVDKNAEKLRSKYVSHEGKKTLTVENEFVRGSKSNDWSGAITEFVQQIDKNTKSDTVPLFDCNFSSSTLVEKIAAKVCLMSTCKHYFQYSMMSFGCGFPEITLEGTVDDWILLKKKTKTLLTKKTDRRFGNEWGKSLLPLIDRFIGVFKGDIDMVFWNSMVYRGDWKHVERLGLYGSGGEKITYKKYISGWVNILFPFLGSEGSRNHWCAPYDSKLGLSQYKGGWQKKGPEPNDFPSGTVDAPVEWTIVSENKTYPLSFKAGYMGFEQNRKSLALSPIVGWYIKHKQ